MHSFTSVIILHLARVTHQKDPGSILCNIEEICNISTSQETPNGPVSIEIARKNGIPLHLVIENVKNAWSFLTTLTGYYRLSEKWVFCLCPDIVYPSLNKLLTAKVHGPVDSNFVMEKFKGFLQDQF